MTSDAEEPTIHLECEFSPPLATTRFPMFFLATSFKVTPSKNHNA